MTDGKNLPALLSRYYETVSLVWPQVALADLGRSGSGSLRGEVLKVGYVELVAVILGVSLSGFVFGVMAMLGAYDAVHAYRKIRRLTRILRKRALQ